MRIYAPSYKRAEGVKTHKLLPDVIYVVAEFEAEKYQERGYNVEVIPDKVQGNVARVRNYIADRLLGDFGIMIDDDIEAIKRWTFVEGKPYCYKMKTAEILEFFENAQYMAIESQVKLFGVNIIGDKGSYRDYTPLSYTNWISGSLMGIFKNPLSFDESMPLKEDYDYCLQHLNKYRKLLRFNFIHLVKRDHGNKGGCADMRTVLMEKKQMALFKQKWGSIVVKKDDTKKVGMKKKASYDINPIVKVPIKGV